jgi:O-acetyl-ADP-ribose deacetylase (regulator of RNase III)
VTEFRQGNIFEASAEALVNTVNTVGIMGKGVALQFRRAFPDNYKAYAKACKREEVEVGKVFVYHRSNLESPMYIFNFPTKRHWRERSRLEYVQMGLEDLVGQVRRLGIQSIALPPLGCGNGNLDWKEVRPLIEAASDELPEVEFIVYEPHTAEEPRTLAALGSRPKLTSVRAALLKLFAAYEALGESISKTEAQKLAYFLQSAGMEDLKVDFVKHKYGPYSEALNHVLEDLDGYYFEGYGDRTTGSRIQLVPDAAELADSFLNSHPEVKEPLERTECLISGFESRYGMELLATVHWVAHHEEVEDFDSAVEAIQLWNKRKKYAFAEEHLRIAWKRLLDEGWITQKSVAVR